MCVVPSLFFVITTLIFVPSVVLRGVTLDSSLGLRAAVRRVTLETDTSYQGLGAGHSLGRSQFTVCCRSRGQSRVQEADEEQCTMGHQADIHF